MSTYALEAERSATEPTDKITVCHVLNSLENGGAQNLLLNLIESTAGSIDYCIAYHNESDNSIEDEFTTAGAHTVQLEHSFLFDPRATAHLNAVVERHDIDVLHGHLPYQQLLARWSGRHTGVPVVGTHHNLGYAPHPAILSMEKLTRRLEDRTVGVTESVRQSHESTVFDGARQWDVVYNGIDVEAFRHRVESYDSGQQSGTTFLNVGRYLPSKAQRRLIDAMEPVVDRHPDAELYVVGWGQLETELRDAVRRKGLEDNVEITGYTDEPEKYYAKADVYATSAPAEGHPMTIIEAMASGVPILSQNYNGAEEVILDGETGVLTPVDDQEAFVEAMLELYDESRREALGAGAYERAVNMFDVEQTASNYAAIYTDLHA